VPECIIGLSFSGGNKYSNLALQVGEVSKIERVKFDHASREILR
jgi:hypothetical protein